MDASIHDAPGIHKHNPSLLFRSPDPKTHCTKWPYIDLWVPSVPMAGSAIVETVAARLIPSHAVSTS